MRPSGSAPIALPVAAIVLLAATLRIAVASFSPLLDLVQRDIAVPSVVNGLIGAAPPVGYAVFGILTPALTRRLRLETLAVLVAVVTGAGLVGRSLAGDAIGLVAFTAVAFAGVGVGNVLLPGLVKKYFPDRIGALTTVYISTMSVATIVPPLVEVGMAQATGWRFALGVWTVVAVLAVVPWAVLLVRSRGLDTVDVEEPTAGALRRLLSLRRTWALVVAMVVTSATAYTAFAWLPTVLRDVSGVDAATAGALLAVFAGMGLPFSLFAPLVVVRFGLVRTLLLVSVLPGLAGVACLVVAPAAAPLLWVVLLSLPTLLFPVVFTLIGLRTRRHTTTVALSSVVQSLGYGVAAVFPLTVGALHQATGGWTASLVVIGAMIASGLLVLRPLARPGTVESDWEACTGRTW